MRENELANRMALRQLGMLQDEETYEEDYIHSGYQSNISYAKPNYAAVVSEISRKIAKSAFNSDYSDKVINRLNTAGEDLLDYAEKTLEKPSIREGLIIGSVFLLKGLLYFAYKNAAKEGLNIIEL